MDYQKIKELERTYKKKIKKNADKIDSATIERNRLLKKFSLELKNSLNRIGIITNRTRVIVKDRFADVKGLYHGIKIGKNGEIKVIVILDNVDVVNHQYTKTVEIDTFEKIIKLS